MGLSRRQYGDRRGVSEKAVRKALKDRIAGALLPDDTIDADLADQLWEQNTRVSQRRGAEAAKAQATIAAIVDARSAPGADPADPPQENGSAPSEPGSAPTSTIEMPAETTDNVVPLRGRLEEHRQANLTKRNPPSRGEGPQPGTLIGVAVEIEEERLRKMRRENDIAEGLLVPAAAARAHFFTVIKASTAAWEGWPDRVSAGLAAKFGIEETHTFTLALRALIRTELAEQSSSQADIDAARRS